MNHVLIVKGKNNIVAGRDVIINGRKTPGNNIVVNGNGDVEVSGNVDSVNTVNGDVTGRAISKASTVSGDIKGL